MGTGVIDMVSCASKNVGVRAKSNSAMSNGIRLIVFIGVFVLVCLFFGN